MRREFTIVGRNATTGKLIIEEVVLKGKEPVTTNVLCPPDFVIVTEPISNKGTIKAEVKNAE